MSHIASDALAAIDVNRWRERWSQMMAGFVPGLESLEEVVYHAASAALGGAPARVLDLGGGPGLLAEVMAARWPDAAVTMVDLDPVLLALARSALADRVRVVDADLARPGWPDVTGAGYDLVVAVMTMHYLSPDEVRSLYRDAVDLLRPGGLLVVADPMPDDGLAELMRGLDPMPGAAVAELDWVQWWNEIASAAEFRQLAAERDQLFRGRPTADFTAPLSWHLAMARQSGFANAGVVWRCGRYAALAAIR